ncbi:MAG TPA: type II secretion system F family protein [Chloroflexia bacterium]|nr:type II secretion system F family protein [Chloroflexia bacterium]
MQEFLVPALVALGVLGLFALIAKLSLGNSNVQGRLASFVGDGPKPGSEKSDEKKGEKKQFSLGLGETQLAAKVDKAVAQGTFGKNIQRKLAQADLKLTLFEFMLAKVSTTIAGAAVGLFVGRGGPVETVVFGLAGMAIGFFGPDLFVKFRLGKRLSAFNGQLSDTLALLANSLRSGYSMLQSIDLVARESQDPIGKEFKRIVREVGLGLTIQDALGNLYRRMPSDDLDLMITAINIQYEVGGNLAQILDSIAHTIRERVRIKGEMQTLTAQGRVSGYIITALPILIGLAVTVINPEYMSTLWVFPWIIMPICGGVLVFAGFMIIRKIVNIEV